MTTCFPSDRTDDDWEACVENLGVADQGGYRMALTRGKVGPHNDLAYLDACEQINMRWIPPPG